MVKSLQAKLDDAVNKISELTDVLTHLNPEYDADRYYEDSAKQAMQPVLAAQSNYGAAAGSTSVAAYSKGGPKSDIGQSQITNATQKLTRSRRQ